MPRWLIYSILTVIFWGVWGFIPGLLGTISAEQRQVLSILGLLPIMGWLAWRQGQPNWNGARVHRGCLLAFVAGLVGNAGNLFFYQLISAGQSAATVVPLTSLYPLVTVLLAFAFLKEELSAIPLVGIGLALISIYFFNVGRPAPFAASWLARALLPIGLWGIAGLLQKICTNDVSAELSTLSFLG